MTSVRLFTRIQVLALVWLIVLVWLSQSSLADRSLRDASDDKSDDKDKVLLKAIRPLEADLKRTYMASLVLMILSQIHSASTDEILHMKSSKNLVQVDLGFIHAFLASLSVIIVSELGDKTFFIAAILAMKNPRLTVFAGAMVALGLMTVLSALLGFATTIIPRWFTYYVSCALFAIFGLKMLREAYTMDANEAQEEYEEVQSELRKKEEEVEKQNLSADLEGGVSRTPQRRLLYSIFSRVFLQSFMLTFLAEWGDRSQIATIILAARDEVIGVIIGGTLGHALCTSLAVIGGRCIAQHISLKTVHLVGGLVFLIFALSALFIQPDDHE